MSAMTAQATQVYSVFVRATPEQLWDAITKPEFTSKYFYGSVIESTWEAGSTYAGWSSRPLTAVRRRRGDRGAPPSKLVTTWRALYDPETAAEPFSRVTWEIEPAGERGHEAHRRARRARSLAEDGGERRRRLELRPERPEDAARDRRAARGLGRTGGRARPVCLLQNGRARRPRDRFRRTPAGPSHLRGTGEPVGGVAAAGALRAPAGRPVDREHRQRLLRRHAVHGADVEAHRRQAGPGVHASGRPCVSVPRDARPSRSIARGSCGSTTAARGARGAPSALPAPEMSEPPRRRELPQVLIGLVAVAVALAVAVPLTASIVMGGIRDVKTKRDTIVVTGSAKYPITANQAFWDVTVSSTEREPAAAARSLRVKSAAVAKYLEDAGLAADVSKPPVDVQPTSVQIPTGLAKPRFRSVPAFQVTQSFDVQTTKIDTLVKAAAARRPASDPGSRCVGELDRVSLDQAEDGEVRGAAPGDGGCGGTREHDRARARRPSRRGAQRQPRRLPDHAAQLDRREQRGHQRHELARTRTSLRSSPSRSRSSGSVEAVEAPTFEEIIQAAIDSLPAELRDRISNVEIVVEDEPPPGQPLLGLYQGVPLTRRGIGYNGALPDKITIYRGPLERLYGDDPRLLRESGASRRAARGRAPFRDQRRAADRDRPVLTWRSGLATCRRRARGRSPGSCCAAAAAR